MKKISTWALHHPGHARLLMIFIKIILFFLALYIGNRLQEFGFYFSVSALYFVLLIFLLAVITYPDKRLKKVYFEARFYARQKINDFLVAFSSFMVLIVAFNTNLFSNMHNPLYASAVVTKSNIAVTPSTDRKQNKISAKEWRQIKAKFKKQLKRMTLGSAKRNEAGKNKGLKLALAIAVGVVLTALLAAFACAIACNGSEVLAVVIAAVGIAGIIWGLIAWIKSIYRNKGVARRKKQKKETGLAINL